MLFDSLKLPAPPQEKSDIREWVGNRLAKKKSKNFFFKQKEGEKSRQKHFFKTKKWEKILNKRSRKNQKLFSKFSTESKNYFFEKCRKTRKNQKTKKKNVQPWCEGPSNY